MGEVQWRRVNDEPFEYAIQQGSHGDEFVKLLDGSCLRRDKTPIYKCRSCGKIMSSDCDTCQKNWQS